MIHSPQPQTKGNQKQVIIKLWGGLGNQMFQYAFGLSVSKALALPLKVDLTYFASTPTGDTIRSYELAAFNLNLDAASDLPVRTKTVLDKVLAAILRKPRFTIVTELHYYTYDEDLLSSLSNRYSLYLDGYWQSYKYIDHLRDELRASFRLKQPLTKEQADTLQQINSKTCVAIHVRRGDYISSPSAAAIHNLYDATYYSNAMVRMYDSVPDAHFLVFSDDIAWCKKELHIPYPHTFIQPDTTSSAVDIYLMSLCQHHIITNSTYGWWGAWLADNPSKVVIAPKQWLAKTCANSTADGLIPPEWIRM